MEKHSFINSQFTRVVIFGPPCVGKSTALGYISIAASKGVIPCFHIIDLEAFIDEQFKHTILQEAAQTDQNVAIGGNGYKWKSVPQCYKCVLILPSKEDYLKIYDEKAKARGTPVGKYHTPNEIGKVYDDFLAAKDEFHIIITKAEDIISALQKENNSVTTGSETSSEKKEAPSADQETSRTNSSETSSNREIPGPEARSEETGVVSRTVEKTAENGPIISDEAIKEDLPKVEEPKETEQNLEPLGDKKITEQFRPAFLHTALTDGVSVEDIFAAERKARKDRKRVPLEKE